ncbi:MAG: epoxyqueuosine reductase [Candidatus Methanoperedens sp.]|nr:epoxyqueuosine reductase [Candidatus Methanoperedens sp.]
MKKISSDAVKRFALKEGADLTGIASIDRFKEYPEEKRPEYLLSGARSVIVVGVRVLHDTVKPNLLLSALHHITLNMYHNQIAYDIGRFLDDRGYSAVIIPHRIGNLDPDLRKSGDYMNVYPRLFGISTRHAAVEAGLGILGKSRLLITPRFGPRQRVAAVITDAQLSPDRKITKKEAEKLCPPSCQGCIRACPGNALSGEGIAWEKCNEVIKPHNGMYGYSACCECMVACPAGRNS